MSVGVVNKQTGDRIPTAGMPAIDSVLSGSSTNPVQNRIVKAALDEKADTDLVASDFDATASYTAGNYCIYEGKFYRFKNNHSGAWAAADVDEIQIAGELSSIKSGLNNVGTGDLLFAIAKSDMNWNHTESNLSDYRYLYFTTSYYSNTPNPIYTSAILPLFVASTIGEYYQMDADIKINFMIGFGNIKVQDWGNTTGNYLLVYGIK